MRTSPYPLSEEQVRFYRQNGFVQLPEVLDMSEVAALRSIFTRAVRDRKKNRRVHGVTITSDYERVFVQMVNLWEDYAEIRPFVLSERIAGIARRLTGSRSMRLWHDHALIKMPGDSRETPWHQDLPYWPMDRPGALSCWLALDDVTEGNGCLQFVPESHKLGALKPISLAQPRSLFEQPRARKYAKTEPAVMSMKAGSCTFHDGNTFHAAGANRTKRPRRALAIIYIPPGVRYNGNGHVVSDKVTLTPGQTFKGDLFPVVA